LLYSLLSLLNSLFAEANALMLSWLFIRLSGRPAFRIYGRGKHERSWRVIHVFATARRNMTGRLPFFGGTCIAWGSAVIAVGWDFAESVVREQMRDPASRERPIDVCGGRVRGPDRRRAAGAPSLASASEILAHECGHTAQARRLGPLYLPIGAVFTWWREGRHWWNWFENQASAMGEFGGILSDSIHPSLWSSVQMGDSHYDR
jgi:hypothetical protein